MRIEHLAINLDAPADWAAWYVRHCGFKTIRVQSGPPWTHFIADSHGAVLLEVYDRTDKPRVEWRKADPILFHIALVSDAPEADARRLCAAGATRIEGGADADGYGLIMLRDPWGVPLQLCCRREPFPLT
jgi:glyoxylase I family protein